MSKKYTFHIAGPVNQQVHQMMEKEGYIHNDNLTEADVVLFTGGADITPFLYGERPLSTTRFDADRDMLERREYQLLTYGQVKVGICRGAQFLNVMNGGSMWQHAEGHLGSHLVRVDWKDGPKTYMCSSTHHQMMIPGAEGNVVGWSNKATSVESQFDKVTIAKNEWTDPEIIEYWTSNTLCFQPHPEYGPDECRELFFKMIEAWLPKEKKAD